MGAIDEYLKKRATNYSDMSIEIYKARIEREKKEEEERRKRIEERNALNDEMSSVRKESGLDTLNSLVEANKTAWNGGNIEYNPETGLYEGNRSIKDYFTSDAAFGIGEKSPRLVYDVANLFTFGAVKGHEQNKIEKSYEQDYDNVLKNLKDNKEEYIKRIGADNYYSLLNEVNEKASLQGDSLSGYKSDVELGDLQVKRNSAWDKYYKTRLNSDKEAAQKYDEMIEQFIISNPDVNKQTFSGTANYLPQAVYYAKKNLPGAVGAAATAAIVSKATGNKQLAATAAGKVYGATQIAAGFQGTMEQTRGAEFGDMIRLGIPEDIAAEAAQNSAFWQSLIEEAETAKDIYMAFKVPQSATVSKGIKQFMKNWGVNVVTEGLEEGSQSIVGYIYEWDAAKRAGIDTSGYTISNMAEQAWEEAKGGAEIGATMYIADSVPHIVIGTIANNRAQRLAVQDAPVGSALETLQAHTDGYGNQTVSEKNVKNALVKVYDQEIALAKKEAAKGGENAAQANKLVQELEAGKKRNTTDKAVKALTDGLNKSLDNQATNKKQSLTEAQRKNAEKVLAKETEGIRKGTQFKNIELTVADKITAGQSNLASFAKNVLGLDVIYYKARNVKDGNRIYKSNGLMPTDGNTVYINASNRTTKNALSVLGHEFAHNNIDAHPDMRKPGGMLDRLYTDKDAAEYRANKKMNYSLLDAKEEMYADDVGEYLSTKEVIANIENNDQSAMSKIKNTLANFAENTLGVRPQFDSMQQYNLEGTSKLNGLPLATELREQINEEIKNRQNKKKETKSNEKKAETKEETKKETKKTEKKTETKKETNVARKITDEQRENNKWYAEQKADNKRRDEIQRSLATRMKKGVNAAEVKAELDRLERQYKGIRRSAEIVEATEKDYSKGYRASDGTPITNAVAEWAKDSTIRTEDGTLVAALHGSTSNFESFDDKYMGSNGNDWGQGYYFTDKEEYASAFGSTRKFILNIKNPLVLSKKANEDVKSAVVKLASKYDAVGENAMTSLKKATKNPNTYNLLDVVRRLSEENNTDTRTILKEFGYDGIVDHWVDYGTYIIFDSNQAKYPDNPNPTENKEFRRSAEITDESKQKNPRMYNNLGERLSPGIMKKYRDSKIRDENGNLLVVYHTTTETMLVPFSEFKPEKEGKYYNYNGQTVIFVTPSLAMSTSYMQLEGFERLDSLKAILDTDALRTVKNKKIKSIKEAKELLPYFVDIRKTKDGKITLVNTTTGSTWGQYENFRDFSESLADLIEAKDREYIDLEDQRKDESVGKNRFWQYPLYMNVEKPFIVDGKGKYWNKILMNLPKGFEEARRRYEEARESSGVMAALGIVMEDIINEEQSTPDKWYSKYTKKAAKNYGIDELRYTAERLLGVTGDIVKYIEKKYGDDWATDLEKKRKKDYDEFNEELLEVGRDVMAEYSNLLEKALEELVPRSAVAGLIYENRRSIPYSAERFRYMMFKYFRSIVGEDWERLGWKEVEENRGSYFAKDAVADLEIMFNTRAGSFDIDKSDYSEYSRDRNRRARKLKKQEEVLEFETNDIVKIALRRNFQKNVANLKKTSEAIQNMSKLAKQKLGYAMVSNYYNVLANGVDAKRYGSVGEAFSDFVIRDIKANKELDGIRGELEKNPKILEQFFNYFKEKVPSQLYPHSLNIGDDVVYRISEKQLNAIFEKAINEKNIGYLKGDFFKPERYRAENALLNSYDTDEEKNKRIKLVVADIKGKIYSEPVKMLNKFLTDWRYNTSQEEILAVDGYDGVWIKNIMDFGNKMPEGLYVPNDIYIAFASNQVDLISNKNPTMDPNIKRSSEIEDTSKKKWNGKAKNSVIDYSRVKDDVEKYVKTIKLDKGYRISVEKGKGLETMKINLQKETYEGKAVDSRNKPIEKYETIKTLEIYNRGVKQTDNKNGVLTSKFDNMDNLMRSIKDRAERLFSEAIHKTPSQKKALRKDAELKTAKNTVRKKNMALRWSWKKNKQQQNETNKWKAKNERAEKTITRLVAKAKEKQAARKLSDAKRDFIKKLKDFEKSNTFKFMTKEQRAIYDKTFGNIYKKALSKTAITRQHDIIKSEIARQLLDNPDIVVSDRVKKMVTAPAQVEIGDIETIDEMNELLDVFEKITEQVGKQEELVGLTRKQNSLKERTAFAEAVKEREEAYDTKKSLKSAKRDARSGTAVGRVANGLGRALDITGRTLKKHYLNALETLETELLAIAGGNRKSKIMQLYENLNNGVTSERSAQVRLQGILQKFLEDDRYKTLRRQLNPKTEWYDTGITVKDTKGKSHKLIIDHGRLISLAMHSMQEQSLKHIGGEISNITIDDETGKIDKVEKKGGGLTIPDMELAKAGRIAEAINEGYIVRLTPAQINEIVGKDIDEEGNVTFKNLTEEENEFIKGIQEFFLQGREYLNEVSNMMRGYDIATEENYFPIVANKSYIFRKIGADATAKNIAEAYGIIDGAGFTQGRKDNAFNPIVLENVADVLTRAVDGISKYYAYNTAIYNNQVLLNTKFDDVNVREAIAKIDPGFIENYNTLEGFIAGILSHPNTMFARFRGRHAEFTLGLNPSSWVKQLLSVPTTMKYFTNKEMASFIGGGEARLYETMKSYLESVDDFEKGKVLQNFVRRLTPDLDYRALGFGLPDLSDIRDNKSLFQRMDLAKGIARFDRLGVNIVTSMYLFAELGRRGLLGNELTKLSAEEADQIFQEVGKNLEHFLRVTQPDYSQTNRANISRGRDVVSRFLTMYSTPTLQMTNNMLQSLYEFNYARSTGDKELMRQAGISLVKSTAGVAAASIGAVVISRAFSKMFKNPDDEDEFELGKEVVVSMLAPSLVLDDIARGLMGMQQYDSQVPELVAYDAVTSIASNINKLITGEEKDAFNRWKNIVRDLGTLTGIPTRDLMKIGRTVLMYSDSDLYYEMALRENANAYKKWLDGNMSKDTREFYKAYTVTREKQLLKYGWKKGEGISKGEGSKKTAYEKALRSVFGNDEKKINEYMTILGGYKS